MKNPLSFIIVQLPLFLPVAEILSIFQYEKYCAPILNVGGLSIDIFKTDSEGHARRYVEELDVLPHAILCGGGDGTLAEIVTGELCAGKNHLNHYMKILEIANSTDTFSF